jgi:hypothetical protein
VLAKWLPAQAPSMTMLAIGDAVAQLHALPSNVALSEAHSIAWAYSLFVKHAAV